MNWANLIANWVQATAAVFAAGTIVFAVRSYRTAQGHLGFDVITTCMGRFQEIFADLEAAESRTAEPHDREASQQALRAARRYLDLCSEELFYFQQGYVPDAIVDEWIDGMLSYLPLQDRNHKIVFDDYKLRLFIGENDLHDYPRIRESFRVQRRDDLDQEKQLNAYIGEIKQNAKSVKRKSSHHVMSREKTKAIAKHQAFTPD